MLKIEWFKMKKSSFIEGTIIATLAIVFTKILGMLYVIPFYATVGIQGSALYAYAYNIYIIFLDISTAGIPTAMSKIINEYNTLGQMDAKTRAYLLGKRIIFFISLAAFIVLFIFANQIGSLLLGDLDGGNTIKDVAFAIRSVSFALLIIPFLSVAKGYLQGHKIINVSSVSQVIEQIIRIVFIIVGSYLAYKVFSLSLRLTIGIAVFGAFAGGFVAYLYVKNKINKNKAALALIGVQKKDQVSNKQIVKKIFNYAIPFIIISAAMSIYNFVNMIFISRTMNYLNYDAIDVEFITTSITTWGPKISMIVTSLAMGMTTSLIPNIVEAFTLKKWDLVNSRLNKALQIIMFISIPAALGIALLSKPVWTVFYGYNYTGVLILSVVIIVTIFQNIAMITSSTLQSLNKFKFVYIATISGLLVNAICDVPLMLLCHKINIPAYFGAMISSLIGYSLTFMIALIVLKKQHQFKYHTVINTLIKLLVPLLVMSLLVIGFRYFIPYPNRKIYLVLYIGLASIIGGSAYLFITYKMKIITELFGEAYLKKVIKKLTFGKFGN